ncbi:MAG: hypothetical protein ACRD29_15100 [Acidimicrobiales bacterium]
MRQYDARPAASFLDFDGEARRGTLRSLAALNRRWDLAEFASSHRTLASVDDLDPWPALPDDSSLWQPASSVADAHARDLDREQLGA